MSHSPRPCLGIAKRWRHASPCSWCVATYPALPLLIAMLALAVLVRQESLKVIQKHIVHGRERVVCHLYLVDVPVYALMPYTFLRQGTSLSPQRGGVCEAHRIIICFQIQAPEPSSNVSTTIRRACAAAACQTTKNVKRLTSRARACVSLRATADPFYCRLTRSSAKHRSRDTPAGVYI